MKFNKKFENELYLYGYAHVYGPDTHSEPKIGEMGYFTDNMESFNSKDPDLYYVYGELTDYNADCEGHYNYDSYLLSVDNDDYYEGRYRGDFEDDTDMEVGSMFFKDNFAFYIPENSIPLEKREWYRNHAINVGWLREL